MDREVVKELIQKELKTENFVKELNLILGENREKMLNDYVILREKLGGKCAIANAAETIVNG